MPANATDGPRDLGTFRSAKLYLLNSFTCQGKEIVTFPRLEYVALNMLQVVLQALFTTFSHSALLLLKLMIIILLASLGTREYLSVTNQATNWHDTPVGFRAILRSGYSC